LYRYFGESNFGLTREDWATLMDIYDTDKDGCLCYTEFIELFTPHTKEYRKNMTNRVQQVDSWSKYTNQTQKIIKDL